MRTTLKLLAVMMTVALAITIAQGSRNNLGQGNQNIDCTGQPALDITGLVTAPQRVGPK